MTTISLFEATKLSSKILSIGLIVNSLEYFYLIFKQNFLELYPWKILKRKSFGLFPLDNKFFLQFLISLNLVLAVLLFNFASPLVIGSLFVIQWLLMVRFASPFNGGADSLQLLILFCIFLHSYFISLPLVSMACILYLAIQVILSYFIAGCKKLKNPEWLKGIALQNLTVNNSFALTDLLKSFFQNRLSSTLLGYGVLIFEISFFMILFPKTTIIYFILGFLFHLMNFFIFGLNRFFFSWIATYPILLFFIQFIQAKYFH